MGFPKPTRVLRTHLGPYLLLVVGNFLVGSLSSCAFEGNEANSSALDPGTGGALSVTSTSTPSALTIG